MDQAEQFSVSPGNRSTEEIIPKATLLKENRPADEHKQEQKHGNTSKRFQMCRVCPPAEEPDRDLCTANLGYYREYFTRLMVEKYFYRHEEVMHFT